MAIRRCAAAVCLGPCRPQSRELSGRRNRRPMRVLVENLVAVALHQALRRRKVGLVTSPTRFATTHWPWGWVGPA